MFENIIFNQSSEDMSVIPDKSVAMMVTSPPYNIGISYGNTWKNGVKTESKGKKYSDQKEEQEYRQMLRKVIEETKRVLKDDGQIFFNIKNRYNDGVITPPFWIMEYFQDMYLKNIIIWNFDWGGSTSKRFCSRYEYVFWFTKKVRPLFSARAKKYGELNGYAEEMLSGARTIEAYGRQDIISERFNNRNEDAMNAYYNAEYNAALLFPTINFINNISIALVAIFGGILYMYSQSGAVAAGTAFFITLGGVAQFVQYSRKFAGPINEFSNILHEFQSAFSAAERVFRILDEDPEPLDLPDAIDMKNVEGYAELDDITFGYTPDKTILKNVSVAAEKGQTVAIVGPTGAGKTTIINLLMRFYDAQSGEIRIDSIPSLKIKRSDLRLAFTMVLQDTWLFHGTVYENIVYGKENATMEQVKAAAKAAKIDSYIESLPDGYDTVLSDDGVNISKGQRQLITIARPLLSDAPMLILDEATSNVDSRTEIKIQEAMSELMRDRTCFVIAHRLSTIQNADTILVVKDGAIIEQGNHEELIRLGGFYHSLYHSQFK